MSVSNIDNLIKIGDYIIIQRQGFFKLHQLSSKCIVMLGKDKIDLIRIIGKPFWTMFRMVARKGNNREFYLDVCSQSENISDRILKEVESGSDNRNITDDGNSQLLSSDEINDMRGSGHSAQEIVGKLIANSKTFKEKTEYSQEKYLKKKEKKYFEYIIIRKPTIRLLSNIFYTRDQFKVMGLRHDVLAQIFCSANIRHDGAYLLFENGSQALIGAGILNSLSEDGVLINLTVSNHAQKQAILGMNFDRLQMSRFLCVKIRNLIDSLYGKINEDLQIIKGMERLDEIDCNSGMLISEDKHKRKLSEEESPVLKKPRWAEEVETAVGILKVRKVDAIIIACKEYPFNLLSKLIPYLKASCPIVIYCLYREPLMQLYVELKKRKDVIGLHLTENFLRSYQVLSERTHPDVTMSSSGHLLSAVKILNGEADLL